VASIHLLSLSSDHSFTLSHCVTSPTTWASCVFAILSNLRCKGPILCTYCLIAFSTHLLHSHKALVDSAISRPSQFECVFFSQCTVAVMPVMHLVLPDNLPGRPLASSVPAIFISHWICDFPIAPQMGLSPCWVTIIAASLVVTSHIALDLLCAGKSFGIFTQLWGLTSAVAMPSLFHSFKSQCSARYWMVMSTCQLLSYLQCDFTISVFAKMQMCAVSNQSR